jgi:acetyl-CoA C-acetyltransferase
MTEVFIAGIGQTQVGELWEISLRDLAMQAIVSARTDAGGLKPEALFIGNMLAPLLSEQAHLGSLIADHVGLRGIEAAVIEAGGASGGAALRAGYMAVASEEVGTVLVLGVEKYTDRLGSRGETALATATDSDYESVQGLTPTAQAALLMRRYMVEYQAPHLAFAPFPITAHANAAANPNAMFHNQITPETYAKAGIVSDPLNLFDVAPGADGAAALLLTRKELLPKDSPFPQVRISGSSMASDRLALHDRPEPLEWMAVRLSVERACRQAGIRPQDVELFELFDAYSIFSVLSLEASGFAERGQGFRLAEGGQIGLSGKLPLSTFGGLKARGHPGGATGVYQAVEAALQLRGLAGKNQVNGARRAMIQCLGGPASTAVTHILEKID